MWLPLHRPKFETDNTVTGWSRTHDAYRLADSIASKQAKRRRRYNQRAYLLALVEPLLSNVLWISAFGNVLAIVISVAVPSAVVAITVAVVSAVLGTNPL